ncbi:MAG: hypothetical protein KAH18_08380 [Psychromonas sp.]|nr:hypothetical protein [Psychromonas sp.]
MPQQGKQVAPMRFIIKSRLGATVKHYVFCLILLAGDKRGNHPLGELK